MTKIKICGIKTPETAIACFEAGADMIGLVHYLRSPRHVDVTQIRDVLDAVETYRQRGKQAVLVVVDLFPDEIDRRFDHVQIFGRFEYFESLRSFLSTNGIPVVKDYGTFEWLLETEETEIASLFCLEMTEDILEMFEVILPGGNGIAWDWSLARPFCERYPTLIAGGITPENVADVIRLANPYGIDVSSGVESAPGVKDMDKVKRLIENVHQAIVFGYDNG